MATEGAIVLAEQMAGVAPAQAREVELPVRLAAGDEAALREAYRANHVSLRRFARRLVGDAAGADDLVHEVFVRLPRAVRRMRPETPLASFLVSVAVNHARHHVRAAARRRRVQARLAREPRAAGDALPDRDVERRQLARALAEALDQLPLEQRVAFVLCEVEERTSAAAAALVGTNDSTMRARLFHAKRKLRVLLSAWGEHDTSGTGGGAP
jgi:RNA polymerase sigma-70 factor (ECF subfamily)